MIKQYEDAKDQIPMELLPENQEAEPEPEQEPQSKADDSDRSWFSYMTFGLFD
ncbi:hypothetical protein D9M68_866580 [compost metagenome]